MKKLLTLLAVMLALLFTQTIPSQAQTGEGFISVYNPNPTFTQAGNGDTLFTYTYWHFHEWVMPPYGWISTGLWIRYYFQRYTWPYYATEEEEEEFVYPYDTALLTDGPRQHYPSNPINMNQYALERWPVGWQGSARFRYRFIIYGLMYTDADNVPVMVNSDFKFLPGPGPNSYYELHISP
jgi:hypothetical protein